MESFVNLPVSCIYAAITDHFVMLFRDMADEAFYEFHNRESLHNIGIIFVAVVMESGKAAIIFVNAGSSNYGTSQITANVFRNGFGVTFVGLCIDIETVFVLPVTAGLHLLERGTDFGFHVEGVKTDKEKNRWLTLIVMSIGSFNLLSSYV